MIGIRKLALALALVIATISLLTFAAELLYILHLRRKLPLAAGPTGDYPDRFSPESLLASALCCFRRNRSRVEPAAPPPPVGEKAPETSAATEEEELELARWRAACLGPLRVLYTIKEEEEETDSDLEKGFGFGSDKDDETPYYTPESSPARVQGATLTRH